MREYPRSTIQTKIGDVEIVFLDGDHVLLRTPSEKTNVVNSVHHIFDLYMRKDSKGAWHPRELRNDEPMSLQLYMYRVDQERLRDFSKDPSPAAYKKALDECTQSFSDFIVTDEAKSFLQSAKTVKVQNEIDRKEMQMKKLMEQVKNLELEIEDLRSMLPKKQ